MLSTAYLLHLKSTSSPTGFVSPHEKKLVKDMVTIAILLLLVDIAIMIFAIYAVIKCSEAKKWPTYVPILVVLAMLMLPGLGGMIAIGFVIYYFAAGCGSQPKLAFSFY